MHKKIIDPDKRPELVALATMFLICGLTALFLLCGCTTREDLENAYRSGYYAGYEVGKLDAATSFNPWTLAPTKYE